MFLRSFHSEEKLRKKYNIIRNLWVWLHSYDNYLSIKIIDFSASDLIQKLYFLTSLFLIKRKLSFTGKQWLTTTTESLQSCPTLCDPTDGSPPGSAVSGILQARTLEWVAISFSNAWKWKVKVKSLSRVWLFMTPWTAAHQAPLSMGFSRQEYWGGLPLP